MKPINKLEYVLSSHKNRIDPFERQGAVYPIPCKDCNLVYVGETKRSFRTRKKEHIRNVRNATTKSIEENSTALCKHTITLDHELDWENSKVLTFETNNRKRRFIESFYINQKHNSMNDKKSIFMPAIYNNFKFI